MNIYARQTNYSKKQTIESIKLDLEKKTHTRPFYCFPAIMGDQYA